MKYYITKGYRNNIWRSKDKITFEFYIANAKQWHTWTPSQGKAGDGTLPWIELYQPKKELTKNELFLELL